MGSMTSTLNVTLIAVAFGYLMSGCAGASDASSEWVITWGGGTMVEANDIIAGREGEVYTIGNYVGGPVDLDPGPEVNIRTAGSEPWPDVYCSAFGGDGRLAWAVSWGGDRSWDSAYEVEVTEDGSVYVAGSFSGETDLNPGSFKDLRSSVHSSDLFLVKLDKEGRFVWGRTLPGWEFGFKNIAQSDQVALHIDQQSNAYVATRYSPGPSGFGQVNETSSPSCNGICSALAKYNSAGEILWTRILPLGILDLSIDGLGGIYLAGRFSGDVELEGRNSDSLLTSMSPFGDAFLVCLDAEGLCRWARGWGGVEDDFASALEILQDNLYIAGGFHGEIVLNRLPGTGRIALINQPLGRQDVFVASFDSLGSVLWFRAWGGTEDDTVYDLAVCDQAVLVAGEYSGSVDFDGGLDQAVHDSRGSSGAFISCLSIQGDFLSVRTFGTEGRCQARGVAVDATGSVYAVGYVDSGTLWFEPPLDLAQSASQVNHGAYLMRFLPAAQW